MEFIEGEQKYACKLFIYVYIYITETYINPKKTFVNLSSQKLYSKKAIKKYL